METTTGNLEAVDLRLSLVDSYLYNHNGCTPGSIDQANALHSAIEELRAAVAALAKDVADLRREGR